MAPVAKQLLEPGTRLMLELFSLILGSRVDRVMKSNLPPWSVLNSFSITLSVSSKVSFIHSFIHETFIVPLQDTTTQRRSQPSHGQRRRILPNKLVFGLLLVQAPGVIPWITSLSKHLYLFLIMCPKYVIFLFFTDLSRCLSVSAD